MFDSKLIFLLKVFEKNIETFFKKIGVSSIYIIYKRLIKLCFVRNNVLIDIPFESRCLINLINDTRHFCEILFYKFANNEERLRQVVDEK